MKNFSFLAGLEMTENFVGGGGGVGGFQVATMSNLNEVAFELSYVGF